MEVPLLFVDRFATLPKKHIPRKQAAHCIFLCWRNEVEINCLSVHFFIYSK